LRVTRDLFTENFERALVDEERAFKRIVGYLKKTSPHMVERVIRYKEKQPLMEAYGVDAEIKSTLSRRVDLPSGGYLIFDYAEAFTVIDVNTGRFVGSRSKSSGARLEDTITKNNLEAVDRKSTRLNSSHVSISYAVFCLKKKKIEQSSTYAHSSFSHCISTVYVLSLAEFLQNRNIEDCSTRKCYISMCTD